MERDPFTALGRMSATLSIAYDHANLIAKPQCERLTL